MIGDRGRTNIVVGFACRPGRIEVRAVPKLTGCELVGAFANELACDGTLVAPFGPPPYPGIGCAIDSRILGGAVGGVSGHLWRGLSRSDVKELGDVIDAGQAALLIVGESTIEDAVNKAELKAEKHITKELDANAKDVDKAVKEAAKDVG